MKRTAYATSLLGLAMFTAIIAWQGVAEVGAALAVAGWGLVWVALFHLLPMTADTLGWRALFHGQTPALRTLLWTRWIGESVNGLLPVGQVGGDLVKTRLIAARGIPGRIAGATVVVDLTLAVFSQIAFALIGVALLLAYLGQPKLVYAMLLGIGLTTILVSTFYYLQRRGLFGTLARGLTHLASGPSWLRLVGGADSLDHAIESIYRRPSALFRASAWRLLGWLIGTGEVWLAMVLLGVPVSLLEALLLESLGQAVRGAAFAIPGALGVQEGAYVFLGALLGLGPDTSLALSLAKRARELLLGLPGLLAWQAGEGQQLFRRRAEQEGKAPLSLVED